MPITRCAIGALVLMLYAVFAHIYDDSVRRCAVSVYMYADPVQKRCALQRLSLMRAMSVHSGLSLSLIEDTYLLQNQCLLPCIR